MNTEEKDNESGFKPHERKLLDHAGFKLQEFGHVMFSKDVLEYALDIAIHDLKTDFSIHRIAAIVALSNEYNRALVTGHHIEDDEIE